MLTPNRWYALAQSASATVEISLYGEIGSFGVSARDFINDLGRIGRSEKIQLRIHSPGGEIMDGLAIYNALSRHPGGVETFVDGLAASMASVIMLAGSPVSAAANGFIMVHLPMGVTGGTAEEMRRMGSLLDKATETLIGIYTKKTGLPRSRVLSMMEEETWMTAAEAHELGFVDTLTEPLAMAASIEGFDLSRFKHSTRITNSMEKPQTQTAVQTNLINQARESERERIAEIHATATMIRQREGKDFSALAEKFIASGGSPADFSSAVLNSPAYKQTKVVGSGPEVCLGGSNPRAIGGLITSHENYSQLLRGGKKNVTMEFPHISSIRAAAVTTTQTGGTVEHTNRVVAAFAPLTIADLLMPGFTSASSVRAPIEESFTVGATVVAEGAAKPEQAFDVSPLDSPVRKIAAWIKVSDELIQDTGGCMDYLNNRLSWAVGRAEETEILSGSGSGAHMLGITEQVGLQNQSQGADSRLDCIRKAIKNVESNTEFLCEAIVMHPSDWADIEMMKDANGQYLTTVNVLTEVGEQINVPALWGRPLCVTKAATAGVPLVGAFKSAAQLFRRQGLLIEMSNSDQDDFIKNLVTIRAELRAALVVYCPSAFCICTFA